MRSYGKINYKPDYYILCSLKNERYKKLLYKGKEIMEFTEIPYHIKIMILKKKMAGSNAFFVFDTTICNFSINSSPVIFFNRIRRFVHTLYTIIRHC